MNTCLGELYYQCSELQKAIIKHENKPKDTKLKEDFYGKLIDMYYTTSRMTVGLENNGVDFDKIMQKKTCQLVARLDKEKINE